MLEMSLPVQAAVDKEAQPPDRFGVNVKFAGGARHFSFHFSAFPLEGPRGLSFTKIQETSILSSSVRNPWSNTCPNLAARALSSSVPSAITRTPRGPSPPMSPFLRPEVRSSGNEVGRGARHLVRPAAKPETLFTEGANSRYMDDSLLGQLVVAALYLGIVAGM